MSATLMEPKQVMVAVTLDDGSVTGLAFLTVGRGNILPHGAGWIADGWWKREPTDQNVGREVVKAFSRGAQPTKYRVVEDSEVPSDRSYRNAWVDEGTAVTHDMAKARAIHLRDIRAARSPALDQLDRDWMRATGKKDTKEASRIEAERQVLRDLPTTLGVEKAATVDDLKRLWPVNLTKR